MRRIGTTTVTERGRLKLPRAAADELVFPSGYPLLMVFKSGTGLRLVPADSYRSARRRPRNTR